MLLLVKLISMTLFGGVIFYLSLQAIGKIETATFASAEWVALQLDTMFIRISPKIIYRVLMFSPLVLGLLVFLLNLPNYFGGLLLGGMSICLGYAIPRPIIQFMIRRRIKKFNLQMVDALSLISNALKSGIDLLQAITLVVDELPNPISQEFNLLLAENRVGLPLDRCFQNLAKRIPTDDVEMFATSIAILREKGGNLAETFDKIVETIRERFKIENKISALTAQGMIQGAVVSLMPFVLALLLYLIDPDYIAPLVTTPWGYVVIVMAAGLVGLGAFLIWRLVKIEV